MLDTFGPCGPYWVREQQQSGMQAGQYALVIYKNTPIKRTGVSLKTTNFGCFNTWQCGHDVGLQVNFCTGVAQRVPLRILIADLLPTLMADRIAQGSSTLEDMSLTTTRVAALRQDNIQKKLTNASRVEREFLRLLMMSFQCFRLPFHNETNKWTRFLADSAERATFAYIATKCLETNTIKFYYP
jgi:hypothetical protein